MTIDIECTNPVDLDLDTAEEIAGVVAASIRLDGLAMPAPVGPGTLKAYQLGWDGTPVEGVWLARDRGQVIGAGSAELPWRDNTDTSHLSATVHPDHRRRGVGRALEQAMVARAYDAGRRKVYAGAFESTDGIAALTALGYDAIHTNAVRRVDIHGAPEGLWDRLHADAAAHAADYDLVRLVGPTPDDQVDDMVTLFAAMNDAPSEDPGMEDDNWTAERVASYDRAMAARRQTVHRVLARHRGSGEWAGHSVLCIDEFRSSIAFQEDTSVVGAHRGHRLGLLMKTEMLRWIRGERPDVRAADTWNSVSNHHMVAVNEALGAVLVARHVAHRKQLE